MLQTHWLLFPPKISTNSVKLKRSYSLNLSPLLLVTWLKSFPNFFVLRHPMRINSGQLNVGRSGINLQSLDPGRHPTWSTLLFLFAAEWNRLKCHSQIWSHMLNMVKSQNRRCPWPWITVWQRANQTSHLIRNACLVLLRKGKMNFYHDHIMPSFPFLCYSS